jgi:hypothetical protein
MGILLNCSIRYPTLFLIFFKKFLHMLKTHFFFLFFGIFAIISSQVSAQDIARPGVLEFRNADDYAGFLEGLPVNQASKKTIVMLWPAKQKYLINMNDVSKWIQTRALVFQSEGTSVRTTFQKSGLKEWQGTAYLYTVVTFDAKAATGKEMIPVTPLLKTLGNRWTSSSNLFLYPQKLTILEMVIAREPQLDVVTARIAFTITGGARASVQLFRIDGNDVLASDRVVNQKFAFTVPDSSAVLENVLPGIYDVTVTTTKGQRDELKSVSVSSGAENNITIKLPPVDEASLELARRQAILLGNRSKKEKRLIAGAAVLGSVLIIRTIRAGTLGGSGNGETPPVNPAFN